MPEIANSKGAEKCTGVLSYLWEHRVTNGVTKTVTLTYHKEKPSELWIH